MIAKTIDSFEMLVSSYQIILSDRNRIDPTPPDARSFSPISPATIECSRSTKSATRASVEPPRRQPTDRGRSGGRRGLLDGSSSVIMRRR